jgi:hypothetical protein
MRFFNVFFRMLVLSMELQEGDQENATTILNSITTQNTKHKKTQNTKSGLSRVAAIARVFCAGRVCLEF